MTVTIRPWQLCDRAGVPALILPIQTAEFGLPATLEGQPDLLDPAGVYRQGGGEFWVAEAAGEVVGTVALLDLGRRETTLRKMFVRADWRGGEARLGQRLLDTAVQHARAKGFRAITLGTTEAFKAAHRFYERNGFRRIEPDALPAGFPVFALDKRFYRLALG